MTEEEFERAMDRFELDDEYSEYIMARAPIGNGEMLIRAMESGDWYEGFRGLMVGDAPSAPSVHKVVGAD